MARVVGTRFREMRSHRCCGDVGRCALQGDQNRFTVDLGVVAQRFREIHNDARAITRLHDVHVAQHAVAHFLRILTQRVISVREVERYARRAVNFEAGRWIGKRLFEHDLHDDIAVLLANDVDRFNAIALRLRCSPLCPSGHRRHKAHAQGTHQMAYSFCYCLHELHFPSRVQRAC